MVPALAFVGGVLTALGWRALLEHRAKRWVLGAERRTAHRHEWGSWQYGDVQAGYEGPWQIHRRCACGEVETRLVILHA